MWNYTYVIFGILSGRLGIILVQVLKNRKVPLNSPFVKCKRKIRAISPNALRIKEAAASLCVSACRQEGNLGEGA